MNPVTNLSDVKFFPNTIEYLVKDQDFVDIFNKEPLLSGMGVYMGYPQKDIIAFVNNFKLHDRPFLEAQNKYFSRNHPMWGTGYVPCEDHAEISKHQDFFKLINSKRIHPVPFTKEEVDFDYRGGCAFVYNIAKTRHPAFKDLKTFFQGRREENVFMEYIQRDVQKIKKLNAIEFFSNKIEDLIKDKDFMRLFHENPLCAGMGVYLGYPKKDIQYFINNDNFPEKNDHIKPKHPLYNTGLIPAPEHTEISKDNRYVDLINSQRLAPFNFTEKGIKEPNISSFDGYDFVYDIAKRKHPDFDQLKKIFKGKSGEEIFDCFIKNDFRPQGINQKINYGVQDVMKMFNISQNKGVSKNTSQKNEHSNKAKSFVKITQHFKLR